MSVAQLCQKENNGGRVLQYNPIRTRGGPNQTPGIRDPDLFGGSGYTAVSRSSAFFITVYQHQSAEWPSTFRT